MRLEQSITLALAPVVSGRAKWYWLFAASQQQRGQPSHQPPCLHLSWPGSPVQKPAVLIGFQLWPLWDLIVLGEHPEESYYEAPPRLYLGLWALKNNANLWILQIIKLYRQRQRCPNGNCLSVGQLVCSGFALHKQEKQVMIWDLFCGFGLVWFRQYCRLSICWYFDWLWQILSK